MRINSSRTTLDKWLADRKLTLLLLVGESNGLVIHDFVTSRLTNWRRCGLIADPSILTRDERSRWGFPDSGGDCYVVLGGDPPKAVGSRGANKDLLRANNQPSALKIEAAFVEGDRL
jgi:hypothetical protein